MLVKLETMSDFFGGKKSLFKKTWNLLEHHQLESSSKTIFIYVYTQPTYIIIYTCHIWQLPTNLGMTSPHNLNQGVSRRHRSRARRSSKPIRSNHSWRSCAYETARWSGGVCSFIIHVAGESRKYMHVYIYIYLFIYIYMVYVCIYIWMYMYICIYVYM